MQYLIIIILAIFMILFVGGMICKVFLGWTWKKYFDEMISWVINF